MAQNIDQNYLELYLITSQAAGLEPSEGRPLGAGKSTLGLTVVYRAFAYENGTLYIDWKNQQIVDETSEEEKNKLMRTVVEKYTEWSISGLLTLVKTAPKRLPAVLWDDVQLDCPSWQHIPPRKREMIEELSVSRPLVANIVMTTPSMSDIAKPLRRQINWEIIIPTRGTYEVHFIGKRRDFYQPTEDQSRLWYDATGTFEVLPEEIMELYNKRRLQVARQTKRERETVTIPVEKGFETNRQSFEDRVLFWWNRGEPPSAIAKYLSTKKQIVEEIITKHSELKHL
jgi:hypothetical protein